MNEMKKISELFDRPAVTDPELIPLIPNQELYVRYSIFEKDNGYCNMAAGMRIFGDVDIELLNKSIELLIERHDIFRVMIAERNGVYYQRILKEYPYKIEAVDAVGDTKEERFADAYKKAYKFNEEHIDIFKTVLWRMKLYRIDNDEYLFFINMQHAIMDGSTEVMAIVTLGKYYEMLKKGITPPESEYISHREFTEREYSYADTDEGKMHLAYYDKIMEGYKRPDMTVLYGDEDVNLCDTPLFLNKDILGVFFKKYRQSTFNGFMLCYHLALEKILGVDDITVGITNANRMTKEHRGTLGRVSHIVPNRFKGDSEALLTDLVAEMNDNINEGMKHQKCSPYTDIDFAVSYASGIGNNAAPTFLGHKAQSVGFMNKRDVDILFIVAYDREPGIIAYFIGGSRYFDPVKMNICKMMIKQCFYQLNNESSIKAGELLCSPMFIENKISVSDDGCEIKLDKRTADDEFVEMLKGEKLYLKRCDGEEFDNSKINITLEEKDSDMSLIISGLNGIERGYYDICLSHNGRSWLVDSISVE
ncbi:condensation domain-containing protein [Ruminococcus sp.]|uniref:condensation domain-containing protein n=1 Tax=Ruminococcus sp. TaxID=41978 RepID=UPI0025D82301|nr:condensation domain-containing protein [Ruminococcus sp.]MCR4639226.1 hypothetical protein [Ruminococcus sp.]